MLFKKFSQLQNCSKGANFFPEGFKIVPGIRLRYVPEVVGAQVEADPKNILWEAVDGNTILDMAASS